MAVTTEGMLDYNGVVQYIGQNASQYGLDAAAILAVANHEGLNTAPGKTWILPNEAGFNFGPPSWYSKGAGGAIVNMHGPNAATWSWTPAGLDYWMQQIQAAFQANHVPLGTQGDSAIAAIVHYFERPREDLAAGEITNAKGDYAKFQNIIKGIGTPGIIDIPGVQLNPTTDVGANPTTTVGANLTPSGAPISGMNLNFGDSVQHVTMQFLLIIVGVALLLGGIYLLGSRA